LNGIAVSGVRSNLAIFNGTLRNWGRYGVNAAGAVNSQARELRLCTNASKGFWIGSNGVVTDCSAWANGSDGFVASSGSTITRCTSAQNGDDGIDLLDGCTIRDCTLSGNASNGIEADNGNMIVHCTSSGNTGAGIWAVGEGNTVQDCTVTANAFTGIEVVSHCFVLNNQSTRNGYGIHASASGARNRIDGNFVMGNTNYGVFIEGAYNLIVRNHASATVQGAAHDFSIVNNSNIYGQIIGNNLTGNLPITSGSGWENFTGEPVVIP